MEKSIDSLVNSDHEKVERTTSNYQRVKNVIKEKFFVWNCCFFPQLQFIECCNSCEVDVQSHLGLWP